MLLNFSTNSLKLRLEILRGEEISERHIQDFNRAWKIAFRKEKDILIRSEIKPNDIYFFLYDFDNKPELTCAIGKLKSIKNIKIGNHFYNEPVWGMGDIGVSAQQGNGYGKALVLQIIEFAKDNKMQSIIGLHGKMTSLDEFYKKCGFSVDYELGEKLYWVKEGKMKSLEGLNISYLPNDTFIKAAKSSDKNIILPQLW